MSWTNRAAAVTAAALLALGLSACGESASTSASGADPDTLVFAAVPAEESTDMKGSYQPVLDMLAKETGKKIEFRQATDYASVIEGQISGKIQIAQYGPLSFVLAQSKGVKADPVGAYIDAKGGKPGYQSYAITRTGSGITSLADLRGKKVCFVDPNSTSGYLYPSAGLLKEGIDPKTGVQPVFAGGHDSSVLEVKNGRCDAGFAFDSMIDKQLIEKGQLKPGEVTTIWRSPTIPGSPVAVSSALSPQLRATLTTAFRDKANVDYLRANGFCTGECLIGDERSWGFAGVDNASYDPVREVCATTKNENCSKA